MLNEQLLAFLKAILVSLYVLFVLRFISETFHQKVIGLAYH